MGRPTRLNPRLPEVRLRRLTFVSEEPALVDPEEPSHGLVDFPVWGRLVGPVPRRDRHAGPVGYLADLGIFRHVAGPQVVEPDGESEPQMERRTCHVAPLKVGLDALSELSYSQST